MSYAAHKKRCPSTAIRHVRKANEAEFHARRLYHRNDAIGPTLALTAEPNIYIFASVTRPGSQLGLDAQQAVIFGDPL